MLLEELDEKTIKELKGLSQFCEQIGKAIRENWQDEEELEKIASNFYRWDMRKFKLLKDEANKIGDLVYNSLDYVVSYKAKCDLVQEIERYNARYLKRLEMLEV